MTHPRAMLERTTTIAVVGISRHPHKDAARIPAQMQMAGYRIIPVNPIAVTLLGEKVYRTLADIPEPVDLVNVFRPSVQAPDVVREAIAIGARGVWLQLGISSPEARRLAEEAGIDYVENRCIAVEMARYGVIKHECSDGNPDAASPPEPSR